MISEDQARAMLNYCEERLGRKVSVLRQHLLKSRDTLGALWELVVLYTAMQLGEDVEHEPTQKCPDVGMAIQGVDHFWIEATHLGRRDLIPDQMASQLQRWLRCELSANYGIDAKTYRSSLYSRPDREDICIPSQHLWPHLRSNKDWQSFARRMQERKKTTETIDLPHPFSGEFTAELLSRPDQYVMSSGPVCRKIQKYIRSSGLDSPEVEGSAGSKVEVGDADCRLHRK